MCVVAYLLSLPLWERGFKHLVYEPDYPWNMSLPLWERGFKPLNMASVSVSYGRSPCGSVDLNVDQEREWMSTRSRSPCGSVDLNIQRKSLHTVIKVAPLVGAWI